MEYSFVTSAGKPIINRHKADFIKSKTLFNTLFPEFVAAYYKKVSNGMIGYKVKLADGYIYIKLETGHYVPYIPKYWKRI